jgi:hypothetical protein
MGFVCWAWWDSGRNLTSVEFGSLAFKHAGSGVAVARCPLRPTHSTAITLAGYREALSDQRAWLGMKLPLPRLLQRDDDSQLHWDDHYFIEENGSRRARNAAALHFWHLQLWFAELKPFKAFFIPHWVISLAAALLWLGSLLWRAKRRTTKLPAGMEGHA